MRLTEHHDRLIDMLLDEVLGDKVPADLTGKIMARVPRPGRRLRWWIPAAAAALLLTGVTARLILVPKYPEPQVLGHAKAGERTRVQRGETLTTGTEQRDLLLGGYCHLGVEPNSQVQIRGTKRAESVFLTKGGMTCEVNRGKGTFEVVTQMGTVSVTGTRFNVKLVEGEDGGPMSTIAGKTATALAVAVLAGSVSVQHNGETWNVIAGGSTTVAAEQANGGVIEAGKPSYRAKDSEAWKEKGRIVGMVRNAPAFTAKALNEKGETVLSFKGEKGARSYELQWLVPGVYTLEVSAEGFTPLTVKGLEVKAGNDLFVGVEFTPRR